MKKAILALGVALIFYGCAAKDSHLIGAWASSPHETE